MKPDIRDDVGYRDAEALYRTVRQPGTGQVSDAAEIHAAPDGQRAVFTGTFVETLERSPVTRVCEVDLSSAELRVLTFGPNCDRLPKYSPDGRRVAFVSDRARAGDFQLYLLDHSTGAARPTPTVDGWVEYLHWSPDGTRILLGVAGHGSDVSGGQGAITSRSHANGASAWMPTIEAGDESFHWRRAWIYDIASAHLRQVSPPQLNIWEAAWCGNKAIAAVTSQGPSEGLWYGASLQLIDVADGTGRELYKPSYQIGWPAAAPSGSRVAIVEAICSDRGYVAGHLLFIDSASGQTERANIKGVDITHVEWRTSRDLLLAGHRGAETVVGRYDVASREFSETWSSREVTASGRYAVISGIGDKGDCAFVGEGFLQAPEVGAIRRGRYQTVRSFDLGYSALAGEIETEHVSWSAPDGLEIEGWLLRTRGQGPRAVVTSIHGGPVGHWRPMWLARPRTVPLLLLLRKGYAVFLPNPRGSSGRGPDFIRPVLGDMGGADTHDYLSGLDHLVARGIADSRRLGVMGISYGGFMSSWLITQDARFAAAVSVSPVTNQVTEHLLSNIPNFVSLFLADTYTNATGKYFERSPIMHAHRTKTPTLNICGALDRCTPPEEATQFHNALLENGVESMLVVYPEEGHGVQKLPAAIDYAARVVAWFDEHMPAAVG
jgi:dipeptidyl aminopeptidase/acylaminoacyl peptidase